MEKINLGKYTKDDVEDLTGCTPLFLDKCVVENTINLTVDFFKDIVSHALAFEEAIQSRCYHGLYPSHTLKKFCNCKTSSVFLELRGL